MNFKYWLTFILISPLRGLDYFWPLLAGKECGRDLDTGKISFSWDSDKRLGRLFCWQDNLYQRKENE